MATKKASPNSQAGTVKARVLVRCAFGNPDDVVQVTPEQAAQHAGELDTDPAAVAQAERAGQ